MIIAALHPLRGSHLAVNFPPIGLERAFEARVRFARGVGLLALEFLKTLPALEIE